MCFILTLPVAGAVSLIGASLSEPHLNIVHLHMTECMYVCIYVAKSRINHALAP